MSRDCKNCKYFQGMHPNYNDSFACQVYLSLCDADNGETAYMEIHNCPMCGRKLTDEK